MIARILLALFAILAILTTVGGCGIVPDSPFTEANPSPTVVRNVLATRPAIPSPSLPKVTAASTSIPAATPTQAEPVLFTPTAMSTAASTAGFCCLQFAAGPFAQAADTFPAGTEIIYAIWDYAALAPGDRIRRIWIRDDLIWLARDEKWDWDAYGASGTVRDLSIFDYEGSGLQPANYKLQLYLNDTLQQEGTFAILPP